MNHEMPMSSLVSILIPAHNCQSWIAETIQSALSQTWSRKEIIVVDDGSTDGTLEIARGFECQILKVVHQDNSGASSARNRALRECQGDYIQWLDSDDVLGPEKIERQLMSEGGHREPGTLYSCPWAKFYYRISKAKPEQTPLWQDLGAVDWLNLHVGSSWWMPPTVWLVSRELTDKAGPWDERLTLDDDGEYSCRLVSRSLSVRFVRDAQIYYRMANQSSLSRSWSRKAWESLVLASLLKTCHVLRLEDSERTRAACIKGLNSTARNLEVAAPDLAGRVCRKIVELGGTVAPVAVSAEYAFARMLLGDKRAGLLKSGLWRIRRNILCQWDRFQARLMKRH
jgi:glycosyltransferase involved in cell wall biosynthesis